MTSDRNRRTFLKASGAALSLTLVAGCSSGGDGGDGGDGNQSDGGDGGSGSSEVDDWLSDTDNYESVEDSTGESEVTVEVGAGDGGTQFAPPAISVDSGTTVVWEWTGNGGEHDVVDEDGAFESDRMSDEGETFEHTFEESGTFLYKCVPHENMGMKGAVIVE